MLLYFNGWFSISWFLLSFSLFIYKGYLFHYPYAAYEWELVMLFLLAFIENSRLFLASRGNKTEQIPPLVWSICLAVPMIVGMTYYLTLQTYVLRLDLILNAIGLAFVSAEMLLSLVTTVTFYRGFTG